MIPWLLAMIACVAPMRDKGVVPAQSTLEALQQAREPRRYAVVVGVDAYDDPTFPALKHAGDDARAIGERAMLYIPTTVGDRRAAARPQRGNIEAQASASHKQQRTNI